MRVNGHDHDRSRSDHTGSGPDDRARRYCEAALDNAVGTVRGSGDGSRNETLNSAAYGLAQLIGTGGLTEDTIREHLTIAAKAAGLDDREIRTTLISAIRSGRADPRTIPPPSGGETPRRTAPRPAPAPRPNPETSSKRPAMDIEAYLARCTPAAGEHGYIVRKGGVPDGMLIAAPLTVAGRNVAGDLVVRAYDLDGNLQTCQFIPAEHGPDKLSAPGHQIGGAVFVVGSPDGRPSDAVFEHGVVYLVEGIATGWTVHQNSNAPALVTFGKGNLERIAKALRERHPELRIIIVPDVGGEHQAAAIVNDIGAPAGWVEMPEGWPANSDLNDLAATEDGEQLVREVLQSMKEAPGPEMWPAGDGDISGFLDVAPPALRCFVKDRLLANRGHILNGIGGTSKTRLQIHLAIGAVIGRLPWGWTVERTGSAALFLTEDTAEDVHRKLHQFFRRLNLTRQERDLVAKRLKIFPLAQEENTNLLELEPGGALRESSRSEGLFRLCKSIPDLRFIGLDPALSLTEGDELTQAHQRRLGKLVDRLAIESDACVVLVTHAAKSLQNADEIGSHSSRGGGAITDAVRGEYVLRSMTAAEARQYGITDTEERKSLVQLVCAKGNDLPPSAFVPIWLRRVDGGVLEPAGFEQTDTETDTLHRRDTEALAVLRELSRTGACTIGDWLEACKQRGLIKSQSDAAATKAIQRIRDVLLKHGLVERGLGRGVILPVEIA